MLRGVTPALPTLFKSDYAYDAAVMRRHIDRLISYGVHGLFVLGGVGEFLQLKTRERRDIAADVISHVAGRVPVIVGTGSANTLEAVELTQHAAGAGATAVAVLTPTAWHLEEEQLIGHFADIANAAAIPLFIYNLPRMTGVNIRTEAVVRLMAEQDNIVGLIDVTDSLSQLRQRIIRIKEVQPDSVLIAGRGEQLLDVLLLGGQGGVSGTANLSPLPATRLYAAFEQGNAAQMLHYQQLLLRMAGIESLRGGAPAVLKEAMKVLGLVETSTARPPAYPLNAEARAQVKEFIEALRALLADEPGALPG